MIELRRRRGFTLAELMVVMGIIGMLLGLSFAGFSYFRREQQLQATAENLREYLRNARGNSKTSSSEIVEDLSGGGQVQKWIYGYAVGFEDDSYKMYRFEEAVDAGIPDDDAISSFWGNSGWWEDSGKVEYESGVELETVEMTADCSAVGFAAVSGEVYVSPGDTCQILLTLGGRKKAVEVDSTTGEISIVENPSE